jgi:glucokinase
MVTKPYTHCLIADIGGTYTRFAIIDSAHNLLRLTQMENDHYAQLHDAIQAYLQSLPPNLHPQAALMAVAGPVKGDQIRITNRDWTFSVSHYQDMLSLNSLHVINDFSAVAQAIPTLTPDDYINIGDGTVIAGKPVGIIGPGTGLGVALLICDAGKWIPVSSEGGHVTLAAADEDEERVISLLRKRIGHVSAERLVSGPGLALLYLTIAETVGLTDKTLSPNEIIVRDEQGTDQLATTTIEMFLRMLGTVAANLAVTLAAEGGIYFAGGVLPRMSQRLIKSGFRKRFITNVPHSRYLETIATRLIIKEHVAMSGLANYLGRPPVSTRY